MGNPSRKINIATRCQTCLRENRQRTRKTDQTKQTTPTAVCSIAAHFKNCEHFSTPFQIYHCSMVLAAVNTCFFPIKQMNSTHRIASLARVVCLSTLFGFSRWFFTGTFPGDNCRQSLLFHFFPIRLINVASNSSTFSLGKFPRNFGEYRLFSTG